MLTDYAFNEATTEQLTSAQWRPLKLKFFCLPGFRPSPRLLLEADLRRSIVHRSHKVPVVEAILNLWKGIEQGEADVVYEVVSTLGDSTVEVSYRVFYNDLAMARLRTQQRIVANALTKMIAAKHPLTEDELCCAQLKEACTAVASLPSDTGAYDSLSLGSLRENLLLAIQDCLQNMSPLARTLIEAPTTESEAGGTVVGEASSRALSKRATPSGAAPENAKSRTISQDTDEPAAGSDSESPLTAAAQVYASRSGEDSGRSPGPYPPALGGFQPYSAQPGFHPDPPPHLSRSEKQKLRGKGPPPPIPDPMRAARNVSGQTLLSEYEFDNGLERLIGPRKRLVPPHMRPEEFQYGLEHSSGNRWRPDFSNPTAALMVEEPAPERARQASEQTSHGTQTNRTGGSDIGLPGRPPADERRVASGGAPGGGGGDDGNDPSGGPKNRPDPFFDPRRMPAGDGGDGLSKGNGPPHGEDSFSQGGGRGVGPAYSFKDYTKDSMLKKYASADSWARQGFEWNCRSIKGDQIEPFLVVLRALNTIFRIEDPDIARVVGAMFAGALKGDLADWFAHLPADIRGGILEGGWPQMRWRFIHAHVDSEWRSDGYRLFMRMSLQGAGHASESPSGFCVRRKELLEVLHPGILEREKMSLFLAGMNHWLTALHITLHMTQTWSVADFIRFVQLEGDTALIRIQMHSREHLAAAAAGSTPRLSSGKFARINAGRRQAHPTARVAEVTEGENEMRESDSDGSGEEADLFQVNPTSSPGGASSSVGTSTSRNNPGTGANAVRLGSRPSTRSNRPPRTDRPSSGVET